MIPAADAWGPFRPDIDPAERKACLRCLRAVVHLSTGPRGQALSDRQQAAVAALEGLAAGLRAAFLETGAEASRP